MQVCSGNSCSKNFGNLHGKKPCCRPVISEVTVLPPATVLKMISTTDIFLGILKKFQISSSAIEYLGIAVSDMCSLTLPRLEGLLGPLLHAFCIIV